MKPRKIFYYNLLVFTFFFFANLGNAQSEEIKIRFIANCALHLNDGVNNIYIDFPYHSGAYGYMTYDDKFLAEIEENSTFIFTHLHKDHYSRELMKQVLKEKTGNKFTQWNTRKLKRWAKTIPNFEIESFKTRHRFSIRHRSYLISWHGKRIFISGDAEQAETIGKIKNIDIAFLPYWLLIDAENKGIKIDAQKIAIYHIGPAQIPSATKNWQDSDVIYPLVKQGDVILLE